MSEFEKEVDFNLNNFGEPQTYDSAESLAKVLLNLFLLKPGSLPSLPHVGINIQQYLYNLDDGIDVDGLKNKIYNQCPQLVPHIALGEVRVFITPYKNYSVLIVSVPIAIDDKKETILYGFGRDEKGNLLFNFQFQE